MWWSSSSTVGQAASQQQELNGSASTPSKYGASDDGLARKPKKCLPDDVLESMNHYEVLGVPWGAEKTQIIKAYREQARIWHPDKAHPDDRDACTRRFKRIQAAHQSLTDKSTKPLYDEYLRVCSGYSLNDGFEGTFAEFEQYAKFSMFPDGQTYRERILERSQLQNDWSVFSLFTEDDVDGPAFGPDGCYDPNGIRGGKFTPSFEDMKFLAMCSGGLGFFFYFFYKFSLEEKWFLANIPFLTSLGWVQDTLPESFGCVLTGVEWNFTLAPIWMYVLSTNETLPRSKRI